MPLRMPCRSYARCAITPNCFRGRGFDGKTHTAQQHLAADCAAITFRLLSLQRRSDFGGFFSLLFSRVDARGDASGRRHGRSPEPQAI